MSDEKSIALIPPTDLPKVRVRSYPDGPSWHTISHAFSVPHYDDLLNLAPTFELQVPTANEVIRWDAWTGQYYAIPIRFVIKAIKRVGPQELSMHGDFYDECLEDREILRQTASVHVFYNTHRRMGTFDIGQARYLRLLQHGREMGYFT